MTLRKSYTINENINAIFEAELKQKSVAELPKEAEPKEDDTEAESDEADIKDSEVGVWIKVGTDWIVRFMVGATDYSLSFSPLDKEEKHWKFTYFKTGQRDSSDIRKFGDIRNWQTVWKNVIPVIKDFIRIFSPETIKFIGMSSSKRQLYYKELFKMYIKNFLNTFRNLGYHTSFDHKDYQKSPSFVVRKGSKKSPPETQEEGPLSNFELVEENEERKILRTEWSKDSKKYKRYKVEFAEDKTCLEKNFENSEEGLAWAKGIKR